ncbi:MAG: hypothetical protein HQK67_08395, partial [Desulfamplus sp.]|nr:hypothetical protein [Desulfamplus sp.]
MEGERPMCSNENFSISSSFVFSTELFLSRTSQIHAETMLGLAGITVNKNSVPNDPLGPSVTSGIRIGTPLLTSRG